MTITDICFTDFGANPCCWSFAELSALIRSGLEAAPHNVVPLATEWLEWAGRPATLDELLLSAAAVLVIAAFAAILHVEQDKAAS